MHDLKPVYSVAARRALVADMYDLGLMPQEMLQHIRRELGREVEISVVYNDIRRHRQAIGESGNLPRRHRGPRKAGTGS